MFEYDGGRWRRLGRDLDGVASNNMFGTSVALSADGNIVAAGAVGNDANGFNSGHVRVFANRNA